MYKALTQTNKPKKVFQSSNSIKIIIYKKFLTMIKIISMQKASYLLTVSYMPCLAKTFSDKLIQ